MDSSGSPHRGHFSSVQIWAGLKLFSDCFSQRTVYCAPRRSCAAFAYHGERLVLTHAGGPQRDGLQLSRCAPFWSLCENSMHLALFSSQRPSAHRFPQHDSVATDGPGQAKSLAWMTWSRHFSSVEVCPSSYPAFSDFSNECCRVSDSQYRIGLHPRRSWNCCQQQSPWDSSSSPGTGRAGSSWVSPV